MEFEVTKRIALCTQIPEFNTFGSKAWNRGEICAKYPGSAWIAYFENSAQQEGIEVISGLEAELGIQSGNYDPKSIYLIQEQQEDPFVTRLRSKVNRSVVYSLESPLYDPLFYDRIPEYKTLFPSQILFGDLGTDRAYFPSFDAEKDLEIPPPPPRDRKPLACMIISNKHYSQIRNTEVFSQSKSWKDALAHQLHDHRYQLISESFVRREKRFLDLYGKGWGVSSQEIPPGKKIEVMRDYQYCFCLENIVMRGYVTEKIIDCFVAGCIPIYRGAPDRADIDPSALIEIDGQWDPSALIYDDGLHDADASGVLEKFQLGQKFLRSPLGQKFSYQSFAKTMLECVLKTM